MNEKAREFCKGSLRGQNFMTPSVMDIDFVPNSNETMAYELSTDRSGHYLFNMVPYGVTIVGVNGRIFELSQCFTAHKRNDALKMAMDYINNLVP